MSERFFPDTMPPPLADATTLPWWQAAAEHRLVVQRCTSCQHTRLPPAPLCPECLEKSLVPEAVSGRATLVTWTENHQPWIPGFDPPYLIAIVEIEEQPGLRLTTNLINCPLERVEIGMQLQVLFEEREDGIYLPLFEPVEA